MHAQKLTQGIVDPRLVKSVCILGKGVTGEAVERYFRSLTHTVDIKIFTEDAASALVGNFDLAVVSPGIPPHSALVQNARACAAELIGEPELAFRISPKRWIVVTGTNGKTTTTAFTAHVLNACGIQARVAGNIGTTCIEAVCERASDEYLVAELSSYQIAYSTTIAPEVAILLNITPDHLSWHGTFEAYRDAKLSLFERMEKRAVAIIDATLAETRAAALARSNTGGRCICIGGAEGIRHTSTQHKDIQHERIEAGRTANASTQAAEEAFVDAMSGRLTCVINHKRIPLLEVASLQIKGEHNQQNALAAAAVALALGGAPQNVSAALASFAPLGHRIEPCGTVRGLSFFNDSKATNPEATLKALDAFPGQSLIILLGGLDKNTPLETLAQAVAKSCKAAVCYGEAGSRFVQTLHANRGNALLRVEQADTFELAFAAAALQAEEGDIVLLSPACASFDEFTSYEHRGRVFKEYVSKLGGGNHGNE